MTIQGRSMDDLPLAAYSTGAEPDARLAVESAAVNAPADPDAASIDEAAMAALPLADGEPERPTVHVGGPTAGSRARPSIPAWLAKPREHSRDPRLLLTGVISAGLVLLVASFVVGGGGPSGSGVANASPSPGVAAAPTAAPGSASVEVSGKLAATYELTGNTGSGAPTAAHVEASWVDVSGARLAIAGPASAGTRTTAADFVLSWTVVVEGAPVTFDSRAGECTVGMAVQPKAVAGSFVCKKLKSADGKFVVDARGTYRT